MKTAALIVAGFVALQHLTFLILEMFLWEKKAGRAVFGMSREQAASTAVMAKNQGLYNGFLVAGLVWGIAFGIPDGTSLIRFFLACVVVAGVYGGATANWRILLVQAVPAAIGLVLLWLA